MEVHHMTRRVPIDPRDERVAMDEVRATLDALASDLRTLWSAALDRGEFDEVTRLVEVSHAVHVAVIALEEDRTSLIGEDATSR
jgi:hypothetical protein